jgi:DNA-binding response OmpR family regulator
MHVLVVDDDRAIAKVLSRHGAAAGHRVSVCGTGEAALDLLATETFDAVILDIGLGGGLDGRDLLARMTGRSGPPVFVHTGRGDEHTRMLCLEYGAKDVFVKPMPTAELLDRVAVFVSPPPPKG